ncbi:hypothetical protein NUACC21_04840 [Scytonema sp. NUACC21]
MNLTIEPRVCVSRSDDFAMTHFYSPIKFNLGSELSEEWDELEEKEDEPKEIGHILATRFDYSYDGDRLIHLADTRDGDIVFFANFFLMDKNLLDEYNVYPSYLFYIEKVFIQPQYRGYDYALKALAMFLELFAKEQVVGCHPCPLDDLKDKYSDKQGKNLMKRYWSKLGLTNYSEKHNILWTPEWFMPTWLKSLIFSYE